MASFVTAKRSPIACSNRCQNWSHNASAIFQFPPKLRPSHLLKDAGRDYPPNSSWASSDDSTMRKKGLNDSLLSPKSSSPRASILNSTFWVQATRASHYLLGFPPARPFYSTDGNRELTIGRSCQSGTLSFTPATMRAPRSP